VISLDAPFTVPKYREAIATFEQAGYDTIIVDSLTHAWAGEGGLLDKQGQLEKDTSRFKNSFQTWREITPEHNKLVEELLNSPSHIIATLRVKTEYVMERNERGKMEPRKVGLAPVFRDGIEYEFTVCMDVDIDHNARTSKDRTRLFDGWFDRISEETGRRLLTWLDSGADAPAPVQQEPPVDRVTQGAEALIAQFEGVKSDIAWTGLDADKEIRKKRDYLREHNKELSDRVEHAVAAAFERVSRADEAA